MKQYILYHNDKKIAIGGRKDLFLLKEIAQQGGDGWWVEKWTTQRQNILIFPLTFEQV